MRSIRNSSEEDVSTEDTLNADEAANTVLSAEDEAIIEQLHAKRISKKRAVNALGFLQRTLPEAQEDAVMDDIEAFGFAVSTPALIQYLADITIDKRPDKRVDSLILHARERMDRVRQVHAEMDVEEPREYPGNRSRKPGRA